MAEIADRHGITLSAAELVDITGYAQPAKQLQALLAMGYWRARRSPTTGAVILERAHQEAVARGETLGHQQSRPRVRPVLVKA